MNIRPYVIELNAQTIAVILQNTFKESRDLQFMSDVLDELALSGDPIDRALAAALRNYQKYRKLGGLSGGVGYEPRDIRRHGAVEVIERRIRAFGSGFDKIPERDSYEAIVAKYPERFSDDVVDLALERLKDESSLQAPTADENELNAKVQVLLKRGKVSFPSGIKIPQKETVTSTLFLRDPAVKAYVLQSAGGICQSCKMTAPFKTVSGLGYLEVHHIKPLSEGGTDTVQNAVAVCPNCHRALHWAEDKQHRTDRLFEKNEVLIRE